MFSFESLELPILGLGGLESELTEEEKAIQENVHRFAREVMRPIGKQLDNMTPEEVVAVGSPLHEYMEKMNASGILDLGALDSLSNLEKGRIFPLIFEELGWGDSGLAIATLASAIPAFTAHSTGDPEIIERFGSLPGCWIATQPDKGSEIVDMDATNVFPGARQLKGNIGVRKDGNDYIVNGQTSAWVSFAPLAKTAIAYLPCDYGEGVFKEGTPGLNWVALMIPLDVPGVTKGKPLNKVGQRPLPQGEIFFDDVRVPGKYAIATGEKAVAQMMATLTFANMEMAATFTGVARSAFDHALAYVHERKQGGTAIINHQSVQIRVFALWQKVEACRALSQRIFSYNFSENGPHVLASVTSKTFVTDTAFQVTSDSLQLFGGNGLTKEYPMEKIMRDARSAMIEDGENTVLGLKGMTWLSRWYQEKNNISV